MAAGVSILNAISRVALDSDVGNINRPRTLDIDDETPDDGSAIPIPREQDDPAYIEGFRVLLPQIADVSDSAVGGSTYGSTYYADMGKCMRKHMLRNAPGLGLVLRADPEYRMEGTLIHRALAHYFIELGVARGSMKAPRWHATSRSALRAELLQISSGFNPKIVDAAIMVMDTYALAFKDDDILPRSVEQTYRVTIRQLESDEEAAKNLRRELTPEEKAVGSWVVTIRPDLVFEHAKESWRGVLHPTDHKTERHPYARKDEAPKLPEWDGDGPHTLSFQQMVYARVLRAIYGPDKVAAPVIQRVSRARGSQTPLFERHPLTDTMQSMQYESIATEVRKKAAEALLEYRRYFSTGKLPIGNSTACKNRGFPCDFIAICMKSNAADRANTIAAKYLKLSTPPTQPYMQIAPGTDPAME